MNYILEKIKFSPFPNGNTQPFRNDVFSHFYHIDQPYVLLSAIAYKVRNKALSLLFERVGVRQLYTKISSFYHII